MSDPAAMPDCVGCTRVVRLAAGEVDRILSEYFTRSDEPRADSVTAAQRMAVCDTCEDLRYGTTCRHCGCLVAVRVRIAAKSCPAPLPKWAAAKSIPFTSSPIATVRRWNSASSD